MQPRVNNWKRRPTWKKQRTKILVNYALVGRFIHNEAQTGRKTKDQQFTKLKEKLTEFWIRL